MKITEARTSNECFYVKIYSLFILSLVLVKFDAEVSFLIHDFMLPWDRVLRFFTILGDGRFVGTLMVLGLFFWENPKTRISFLVEVVSAALVTSVGIQIFKFLFGRPRPYLANYHHLGNINFSGFTWLRYEADFNSFPSGHTSITVAIAWILMRRWENLFLRIVLSAFCLGIGFTRIALMKHFVADVMGAFALGIGLAQLAIDFCNWKLRDNSWIFKKASST